MEDNSALTLNTLWGGDTVENRSKGIYPCSFIAVFDGHGGKKAAEFVSLTFENTFRALCADQDVTDSEAIRTAVEKTFLETDNLLRQEQGLFNVCGCTGNVVIVTPRWVVCANAGDSRSVFCRGRQVLDLSRDHRPGHTVEATRVARAGYPVDTFGGKPRIVDRCTGAALAVSRGFGDFAFKGALTEPEHQAVTVVPQVTVTVLNGARAFVVTACDGLWDSVTSAQACRIVRKVFKKCKTRGPKACYLASRELLNAAVEKGGSDNITCVVTTV
jgi:serine/threonine protein phosphatase PrpC